MTVTAAVVVSIAVTAPTNPTPTNPSIPKGTTQQFVATGTYSDTTVQTITTTAIWSSSNTAYATVSNSPGPEGLATGVAQGAATIKATVGSVSGSIWLDGQPSGAGVHCRDANQRHGHRRRYVAVHRDRHLHRRHHPACHWLSTWASNNTAVAMISNAGGSNGLATGVSYGSAGITAAIGSIVSPTVTLTVKPAEYAYVANYGDGTVSQYIINPTTGALIANTPATVTLTGSPFAIGVETATATHYVYVLNFGNGNVYEYSIQPDGTLAALSPATVVSGSGAASGPNGLAVTGTNVYVANYYDGTISQFGVNNSTASSAR